MGRYPLLLFVMVVMACGSPSVEMPVVRFVDIADQARLEDAVSVSSDAPPLAEWRFEDDTAGWRAASGIRGLSTRDGYLVGKTSSPYPLLHLENKAPSEDTDVLHGIEVRLRVSAGANLAVDFRSSEEFDHGPLVARMQKGGSPLRLTTPVVAGEEFRTYTMLAHTAPRLGPGVTLSGAE